MTRYVITRCPGCGRMCGVNGSTCKPAPRDAADAKPVTAAALTRSDNAVASISEGPRGRRQSHRRAPDDAARLAGPGISPESPASDPLWAERGR